MKNIMENIMENMAGCKLVHRLCAAALAAALIAAVLLPGAAFAEGKTLVADLLDAPVLDKQQEETMDLGRNPSGGRLPRFIDDVGMVTPGQAAEITALLDDISERHRFDTVIAIVPELDWRETRLYAIDFFEQNGFGYGPDRDGIILLQAVEDRDYGFATLGFGLTAFTDAGQEYLEKLFLPYLKNDEYYEAYIAFAEGVDDFLNKAEAGEAYGTGDIPKTESEVKSARGGSIAASLIVAFIVALIVVLVWRGQLKSVRRQKRAGLYIRGGSMVVTDMRDVFLYKHTTSVRRESNSSGGGGGGGRSGGFTSSSGSSSSGRSGKY